MRLDFCLFVLGFTSNSRIDMETAPWPITVWHGISVYNGYFRGCVSLTFVDERLSVELSLLVCKNLVAAGKKHPTFRMRGERSSRLSHYGGHAFDVYRCITLSMTQLLGRGASSPCPHKQVRVIFYSLSLYRTLSRTIHRPLQWQGYYWYCSLL